MIVEYFMKLWAKMAVVAFLGAAIITQGQAAIDANAQLESSGILYVPFLFSATMFFAIQTYKTHLNGRIE